MKAPSFSISDLSGTKRGSAAFGGAKLTIVIFWSTWSRQSETALVRMDKLYRQYRDKGLAVIAVNADGEHISETTAAEIGNRAGKLDLAIPIVLDRGLTTFHEYGVIALPTTIVVDTDGIIRHELSGYPLVGSEELVKAIVARLEGTTPTSAPKAVADHQPAAKAQLLFNMGKAALKSRSAADSAAEKFKRAAEADPQFVLPWIALGRLFLQNGDAVRAKDAFGQALSREPDNVVALCEMALLVADEGKMEEGKVLLARALSLDPAILPAITMPAISSARPACLRKGYGYSTKRQHSIPETWTLPLEGTPAGRTPPGCGSGQRLPHRIGTAAAPEMTSHSEGVPADSAATPGLAACTTWNQPSHRLALWGLSLLLILAPAGVSRAANDLGVIAPPDRSAVESRIISIVIREGTAFDELSITVNGRQPFLRKASRDRTHICCSGIPLVPGENLIRIAGRKGGKETTTRDMRVFYRTDLSAFDTVPASFTRYSFHTATAEASCRPCHRTDFSGIRRRAAHTRGVPLPHLSQTHRRPLPHTHGPAAVWSCTVCHMEQTKDRSVSRLRADDAACALCHDDLVQQWKKSKHQHGPAEAGKCTTCHNPHASNESAFLRFPPVELCSSCHEETASRPHVISTPGGGHPTFLSPDPFRPPRDFTCVSCHNPHAGDAPLFLKNGKTGMDFCKNCHLF